MSTQANVDQEFGGYSSLPRIAETYYLTRFEYFAGRALQGLLTGKSLKEHDNCVKHAIQIAKKMEAALDEAKKD